MDTLVQSLDLEPPVDLDVECPPLPPEAQRVRFAGVFVNSPPIRPSADGVPSDFCPPNTGFFARAEGHGNSSLFGAFVWSERYCTVPPGELVAEGYFEGVEGDRLTWDALIRLDSIPPPIPFATFSGAFTFTGGTGAYDGASGEALVAAKQLGDAAPGRPAGSTATAVCGWINKKAELIGYAQFTGGTGKWTGLAGAALLTGRQNGDGTTTLEYHGTIYLPR